MTSVDALALHVGMRTAAVKPTHIHMAAPQLLPRVNSLGAPCCDDVLDDRVRLQRRLRDWALMERVVSGDGNCQVCARIDSRAAPGAGGAPTAIAV